MKRLLISAICITVLSGLTARAEGFKRLGAFVGMTTAGDVEESAFAYGVQFLAPVVADGFGIEVALTDLRDDEIDNAFDLQLWNLALSGRLRGTLTQMLGEESRSMLPAMESVGFYTGGGIAYNFFDDPSGADDNLGYQAFVGFDVETGQFGELFLEYRYNFIEIENGGADQDHDMGLFRLGAAFKY